MTRARGVVPRILTSGAVILFCCLVFIAAVGPRGTDQFWYVADVESLLHTGRAQSNEWYPRSIPYYAAGPRPFIHNILPVYGASLLGMVFGAYYGWIVLNGLCALGGAFCVRESVRIISGSQVYDLVGIAFLLCPLTFWVSSQPLAEVSIAFLVALACLTLAQTGQSVKTWGALGLTFLALALSRATFLLVIVFLSALAVVEQGSPGAKFKRVAILGMSVGLALVAKHYYFRDYLPSDFSLALLSGAPGFSNMVSYFYLGEPSIYFDVIAAKVIAGLRTQFLAAQPADFMFYSVFNVTALAGLLSCVQLKWRKDPVCRRVSYFFLFLLGLHLATVVLVQNQARYAVTILPVVMVWSIGSAPYMRIGELGHRAIQVGLIIAIAGFIIIDIKLAMLLRSSSKDAEFNIKAIQEATAALIPGDETVAVGVSLSRDFDVQIVSFALRPRAVLYVDMDGAAQGILTMTQDLGVTWLICSCNQTSISAVGTKVGSFELSAGKLQVVLLKD